MSELLKITKLEVSINIKQPSNHSCHNPATKRPQISPNAPQHSSESPPKITQNLSKFPHIPNSPQVPHRPPRDNRILPLVEFRKSHRFGGGSFVMILYTKSSVTTGLFVFYRMFQFAKNPRFCIYLHGSLDKHEYMWYNIE